MRRPIVFICVPFILGILSAAFWKSGFVIAYAPMFIFLLLALVFVGSDLKFRICLGAAALLLGVCVYRNAEHLPQNHIQFFTPVKGESVVLEGRVASFAASKKNRTALVLDADVLYQAKKKIHTRGKVRVDIFDKGKTFAYGQKLRITGKLYQPFNFQGQGRFNYKEYLRRKNIYAVLSVPKKNEIMVLSGPDLIISRLEKLSRKISEIITKSTRPNTARVLNAMLLGAREEVPEFFEEGLKKTGTVHILAISGLHIGIIAMIFLLVFKLIGFGRRLSLLVCVVLLVAYCAMTEFRVSVSRATIMSGVFLCGAFFYRDYDVLSSLALSALIILWFNPFQIFDLGFELSFLSVFFIVVYGARVFDLPALAQVKNRFFRDLLSCVYVSGSAWLGTAGLIAYHFGLITPGAIAANLVVIPMVFLVIGSGFMLVCAAMINNTFAVNLIAYACEFFVVLIYKVNYFLLQIPGTFIELSRVQVGIICFYYLFLALIFNFEQVRIITRRFFMNLSQKNRVQAGA